ncbi:MAG: response regulator [SAR324 cluster bacterium]|nr:response regulator [SAR324 cluster bacterium]
MNKNAIILCVDDEQMVLNSLDSQLRKKISGYVFEFAESAEEALEIVADLRPEDHLAMVISDQIMPGISGDQLLVDLHQSHPDAVKILLTGQAALESAVNAINNADLFRYLSKPWDQQDLVLTVEKGLKQYNMHRTLQKQVETFKKFVPRQFLGRIARDGMENIEVGHAEMDVMSILFADIRSFTPFAETISPQELLNFLNAYFRRMNVPIHEQRGFIDKFIGDAVMAVFERDSGSPASEVFRAVQSALDMFRVLETYNIHRKQSGYVPIRIGIGVHRGPVIVGTVGSKDRMDSTVIGDTVNIAARLEGLTKIYGVSLVVSEPVIEEIRSEPSFLFRELDWVCVKGKKAPIWVYEIFNPDPPEIRDYKLKSKQLMRKGIEATHRQEWDNAIAIFRSLLRECPQDNAVAYHLQCCESQKNR